MRGSIRSLYASFDLANKMTTNLKCPCENGGICEKIAEGNLICTCVGNWELGATKLCSKYGFPRDAAGIAAFIAQMTGCSAVVGLLSITVFTYILAMDVSPQAALIFMSDMSILIAHILIYTCRSPFIADLSDFSCRFVSLCIQFFCLCHFTFLLFQSLHAYSLTTNVSITGWWPLSPVLTIGVGLLTPVIIMILSATIYFDQYNLPWSCLINFNSHSNLFFIIPSSIMFTVTMVVSEAAGVESRGYKRLVLQPNQEWLSAQLGLRSSVVVYAFSLLAFLFTSMAVFSLSVYISTVAFGLNITFAVLIFFFHSLENTKIRAILKNGFAFIFCKAKPIENHSQNSAPLMEESQNNSLVPCNLRPSADMSKNVPFDCHSNSKNNFKIPLTGPF